MKRFLLIPALVLLASCATLNPGADPFVVRVEQTQAVASSTFDFVLRFDNANRPFWRTNAPAFHSFCEWLRTPQDYRGTNMARAVVIQLNADDLKLAYKNAKTAGNSNALYLAWTVLSEAILQSTSWSNIVVSPVHP